MLILLNTNLLSAAAETTESSPSVMITTILIYVAIFAVFYFFFIRPRSKKQKEEARLRESLDVGDEITTIGGIVGRVVALRDEEDAIIIETGSDRARMKLKKWSVSTIDNEKEEPKKDEESKGIFGKKKKEEDK